MSQTRKKLPLGIQTFAKLRNEGCYYVDKTGFALRLIEEGGYYFLSRPRRFGKSLFLDTLKELFEGSRELFVGLEAENRWDWSVRYPVIRISFSDGVLQSREELRNRANDQLKQNLSRLGLSAEPRPDLAGWFAEMIRESAEKTGQKVVVLVDEYDKPILDNIHIPETAAEMREGLKDLYSVLKGADPYLKFVFLTGVSKFSKVSLFSGLNNLRDITLKPPFSAICGYTEAELDTTFAPELELGDLDREKIREWYNGYNWTGEAVYNPWDILLLFATRQFGFHWCETGSPALLLETFRKHRTFLPSLGNLQATPLLLGMFDVDCIPLEALLFQTGYLTIDCEIPLIDSVQYGLRYPNREVRQSLNRNFLRDWMPEIQMGVLAQSRLAELILANDLEGMGEYLKSFYAGIPNEWFTNNPIAQYEGYYASVFYALFASLGLQVEVEKSSNAGRLDMAVRFRGKVFLFEFKLVGEQSDGSAMRQLREKNYAAAYTGRGEEIYLIGVEFSKPRRELLAWEVEKLSS